MVIANGQVMDPASGLDAVRNIGIRGGKIAAISTAPLRGRTVLDAKGLVVAPGFIDLHSHGQTPENYRYQSHGRRHDGARNGGGGFARTRMVCGARRQGLINSAPHPATCRRAWR